MKITYVAQETIGKTANNPTGIVTTIKIVKKDYGMIPIGDK